MEENIKTEYTIPFEELPKKSMSMLMGILLSFAPFTMFAGCGVPLKLEEDNLVEPNYTPYKIKR